MAAHSHAASTVEPRFPTRPVRLLVPFAASQGSDLLARAIGQELTSIWSQPVVVENRPGANGALAVQELQRSSDDGHTLLLSSNAPIVINPNLYKRLAYRPSELVPLTSLATTTLAILVAPSWGVRTLEDLILRVASKPGRYSYGSPGQGSTSHMAAELLSQATGSSLVHIPYKGSGAALTDLIGGQLNLMIDALPSCLPFLKSGKLLALAVTGERPSIHLPSVQTCTALGVRGLPSGGWYGVFARSQVNTDLGAVINQSVRDITLRPAYLTRLHELGFESLELDSNGFARLIRDDLAFWATTARRLNLYQKE